MIIFLKQFTPHFFPLFPFSLLTRFPSKPNQTMPSKQTNSQRLSDICKPLSWFFPDLDEPSLQLLQKFNILNLLLVYCVPLFYIFYPALLLPAICFRSLSFLISKLWAKMSEANIIRDEDTAEYMGGDDMNFWLQRCSICLDSKFSLFLDSCRDQFCADCFARYSFILFVNVSFFFNLPTVITWLTGLGLDRPFSSAR